MCGICGIFNLNYEAAAHLDSIDRMSERLVHRGPDSRGKFQLPHLALAIRRLSIIDLQTGDQPLSNETGDVTVVFNGEIYNYRELREQLLERGHRFKTRSDGEVIVHLYEDQGPDFVRELNGMFAIALWDGRAKRLVLARDRAGEKPLYYWHRDSTLAFGSEIKALLEYPLISHGLDRQALTQYFFYGYFPAPHSIYAEIKKLPAAHRMVVECGRISVDAYWRLRNYLRPPGQPEVSRRQEGMLAEELRTRLHQAAVSRLVSDVPLGVFLSGGIDSSTLVAVMSKLTPGNVSTFSVAFREKTFSEERYVNLVAQDFRTCHHRLIADASSIRDTLDTLAGHLDEPIADPAVVPTFLLSRFARRHIKVALSGEGADELFGGYPTYLGARLADYYSRLPRLLRRQVFARLERFLPISSSAVPIGMFFRRFLAHVEQDPAQRHHLWFGMLSLEQLDGLLSRDWRAACDSRAGIFSPIPGLLEGACFDEVLGEMLYLDFCMYLQDDLLVKIDRVSMACSLELRTPFLDHRLIEFVTGLPTAMKVRGFRLKYILKKAVKPWLPSKIVHRQKRGFSVPISQWMRKELRPLLNETLGEEKLKRQGIFNAAFVRRLLEEHWSGRADNRKGLWTLLCFQLWYDRWARGD